MKTSFLRRMFLAVFIIALISGCGEVTHESDGALESNAFPALAVNDLDTSKTSTREALDTTANDNDDTVEVVEITSCPEDPKMFAEIFNGPAKDEDCSFTDPSADPERNDTVSFKTLLALKRHYNTEHLQHPISDDQFLCVLQAVHCQSHEEGCMKISTVMAAAKSCAIGGNIHEDSDSVAKENKPGSVPREVLPDQKKGEQEKRQNDRLCHDQDILEFSQSDELGLDHCRQLTQKDCENFRMRYYVGEDGSTLFGGLRNATNPNYNSHNCHWTADGENERGMCYSEGDAYDVGICKL